MLMNGIEGNQLKFKLEDIINSAEEMRVISAPDL
jgi:hypothetical protein